MTVVSKKYWETEEPTVIQTEKTIIKFYFENEKVQIFPVIPKTAYGVGKGVTIDLSTMETAELQELHEAFNKAITRSRMNGWVRVEA